MIFKASKEIENAIKAQGWNCSVDEQPDGSSSAVITGFNLKCGASIQIFFISAADNDAAVRVFEFTPIPAGKAHEAIHMCNDMNRRFRFTKFVAGPTHIGVEMDMPVETQNPGAVCVELLVRLLNIAEEALPAFQQAFGGAPAAPAAPASPSSGNSERY